MVYHFGVGYFLSEHLGLEDTSTAHKNPNNSSTIGGSGSGAPEGVAFSGSSGGGLVSVVLGAGTKVRDVFDYILTCYPECRKNPLRMFAAVEGALLRFQFKGAHKRLSGRIRILLTRVTLWPPL